MNLGGIEIVSCPYAPRTIREQFRFPRSKKARIRKKWRKDASNWHETQVVFGFNPAAFKLGRYVLGYDPGFNKSVVIVNSALLKNFQPVL